MRRAQQVMAGSLGYFWTDPQQVGSGEAALRGYLQEDGRRLKVETLTEDSEFFLAGGSGSPLPSALTGVTTNGLVYLPQAVRTSTVVNFGGGQASADTYHAASGIFGLPSASQPVIKKVALRFPGFLSWAGLSAEETIVRFDADNKVKSATITLESPEDPPTARLPEATLHITTAWGRRGTGPGVNTTETALEVAVSSSTMRDETKLAKRLLPVQQLLTLAYNAWVMPGSGLATTTDGATGDYWNGLLMVPPQGATEAKANEFPVFTLADIGGTRGAARWIKTALDHPRAINPILLPFRGGRTPEEVLTACAQGIEYWVGANTASWAPRGLHGHAKVEALVDRVGRGHWTALVGDVDQWVDHFWRDYTSLKHNPIAVVPDSRARVLAQSARVLLQLGLLREAAQSEVVSERFAGDYRMEGLASLLKPHFT